MSDDGVPIPALAKAAIADALAAVRSAERERDALIRGVLLGLGLNPDERYRLDPATGVVLDPEEQA